MEITLTSLSSRIDHLELLLKYIILKMIEYTYIYSIIF